MVCELYLKIAVIIFNVYGYELYLNKVVLKIPTGTSLVVAKTL